MVRPGVFRSTTLTINHNLSAVSESLELRILTLYRHGSVLVRCAMCGWGEGVYLRGSSKKKKSKHMVTHLT